MKPKRYPSDLTRTQWKRLQRLRPPAKPGGRPRTVQLRALLPTVDRAPGGAGGVTRTVMGRRGAVRSRDRAQIDHAPLVGGRTTEPLPNRSKYKVIVITK